MMAFIRVIAVALALASTTAWSSHPYESARDQYGAREESPRPSQLLNEATAHHSKIVEASTPTPDLQVGCGEGHIHEKTHETDKNVIRKWNGFALGKVSARRKRSPTSWSQDQNFGRGPQYESISVWQPPIYQLKRPYYIPVYGTAGRHVIYYPPQPWPFNPGYPRDNPMKPFVAPTYLPPTTDKTTVILENKFGETSKPTYPMFNGGDNSDDKPIWMDNPDETANVLPTSTPSGIVRPTRLPSHLIPKTSPPLVHSGQDSQQELDTSSSINNEIPDYSEKESSFNNQNRPPSPPPSTTRRPSFDLSNQPTKCVWAIISCCSSAGLPSLDCFAQRGCRGPFWDKSPCDSDFAKSALQAALNYYEAK